MSSYPAHGEMYLIQHYTLCDLQHVGGIPFSIINKTDRHDITEILLQKGVKYHNPNHSA
jgi:hypothetical protein